MLTIGVLLGFLIIGLVLCFAPGAFVIVWLAGALMLHSPVPVLSVIVACTAIGWGLGKWGKRDPAYGALYGALTGALGMLALFVHAILTYRW